MSKQIGAILFIFLCTSGAWFLLGGVTSQRTEQQNSKLRQAVGQLWGTKQKQFAPVVSYEPISYCRNENKSTDSVFEYYYKYNSVLIPLESSAVNVDVELTHRKKGLLWYPTYRSAFTGTYTIKNELDESKDIHMLYRFPNKDGKYDNFSLLVNGEAVDDYSPSKGELQHSMSFAPNETKTIEIAYVTQGMEEWWYLFGSEVTRLKKFELVMTTNFDNIDFPDNSISPTAMQKRENGWELRWKYDSLISGIQVGMVMPQKLNPGPFVSRLSFFAPVSLFLFLFLMFIITTVRKIDIHPMNYFFISASFFSFHLLLAYLVDHINLHLAMLICSFVSLFLVISYMKVVIGIKFALKEVGLSQLVYLVFFSYAFLWEGFTALAVTLCCIITLYIVMRATAKFNWQEHFKRAKREIVPPPLPPRPFSSR